MAGPDEYVHSTGGRYGFLRSIFDEYCLSRLNAEDRVRTVLLPGATAVAAHPSLVSAAGTFVGPLRFSGDGKRDVAIGTDGSSVSVFLNSGSGRLQPRVAYRAGKPTEASGSVEIGHLNDDRKLDIVVARLASVAVLFSRTNR